MKNGLAMILLTKRFYPFSNILLGLTFYVVGLLISQLQGVVLSFLQMWLYSLGCFGIIWVSSFWNWVNNSMDGIMRELEMLFKTKNSNFDFLKDDFLRLISNDRNAFLVSIPAYSFVAYHVWLISSGRITFLMEIPELLKSSLVFNFYSIIFFSICMYFLSATVYMIFEALVFLRKLKRLRLKLRMLPVRRKISFEKTTEAILTGTLGWFVGVSLVMTILFAYSSIIIVVFLAAVIAVGLVFFFVPQIFIHGSICKAKIRLHKRILNQLRPNAKLPLSPECNTNQVLLLCAFFDQVDRIEEWPVKAGTLIQLTGSTIIPIATAIVGLLQK